jgi:hypothetical protein
MLKDIIAVEPRSDYNLYLRFEDGTDGVVDIRGLIRFDGVFAPLTDPAYFNRVRVDSDLGTVAWPNGADLDPDVLYSCVSGLDIASELAEPRRT